MTKARFKSKMAKRHKNIHPSKPTWNPKIDGWVFSGSMLVFRGINVLPSNTFVFLWFRPHGPDLQMVLLLLMLKQKLNACLPVGPREVLPTHENSATGKTRKQIKTKLEEKKEGYRKSLEIVVGSHHWWTTFRPLLHCIWVDFIYKSHVVSKAHGADTDVPRSAKDCSSSSEIKTADTSICQKIKQKGKSLCVSSPSDETDK